MIEDPEDRRAHASEEIEKLGGKLHGLWYAFGDHDGYALWEAPDNVSMAALAVSIASGGSVQSLDTTVLLTVEETMSALQKASSELSYRQPAS